jgi:hypothetical protein
MDILVAVVPNDSNMLNLTAENTFDDVDDVDNGNNQLDTVINYDLNLDQVHWSSKCSLSRASIGQIMVSFKNILRAQPRNLYQTILYTRLKPAVEALVNAYCEIIRCVNSKEQQIKYFNLIVGLPHNTIIFPGEHNFIFLRNPNIGALIKAIKQRITFILERDIPIIYRNDSTLNDEFLNLRRQIQNFKLDVLTFEEEFIIAVDEAYKGK